MKCINLKSRFGTVYKIDREPGHGSKTQDAWLWQIRCRRGHIAPWGGSKLVACTDRRGQIAGKLAALPCVQVVQEGDDGTNAVFDVADFDAVAAVMLPYRRRKLSAEQRAAMAARMRANIHDKKGGSCAVDAMQSAV